MHQHATWMMLGHVRSTRKQRLNYDIYCNRHFNCDVAELDTELETPTSQNVDNFRDGVSQTIQ